MTSQIRREPIRRNADPRRARTMSVQRADELSYPSSSPKCQPTDLTRHASRMQISVQATAINPASQ